MSSCHGFLRRAANGRLKNRASRPGEFAFAIAPLPPYAIIASATLSEEIELSGFDVDRPDDALDAHVLLALVDRDPLLAAHQQVAVRQALRDGHGDVAFEAVALRAGALAVELGAVVD